LLGKRGKLEAMEHKFREMPMQPDAQTITIMIKTYSFLGKLERMEAVIRPLIEKAGMKLDIVQFTRLMKGWRVWQGVLKR